MAFTPPQLLATKKFKARVISETAYGIIADYGEVDNEVRLYASGNGHFEIEWDAGPDFAGIGIWTEPPKHVTDYDGVFELPKEIRLFLTEQGFDLSEVA
jgi:hypothetical protein